MAKILLNYFESRLNVFNLEKKFIDSILNPATIRCLKTGTELYSNTNYEKLISCYKQGYSSLPIEQQKNENLEMLIGNSDSVLLKANFTFCKHLDETFKNREMRTLLAEENLSNQHFISLRTKINYKNNDAMLIIFGENKNIEECTAHANLIHY